MRKIGKGATTSQATSAVPSPPHPLDKNQGTVNCVGSTQSWTPWNSKPATQDKKIQKDESSGNLVGPYGFPLYSDKYNPKPLLKYEGIGTCHSIFSNSAKYDFWIVDLSASEHIIGNDSLFSHLHKCTNFIISLPTGDSQIVEYKGDISIIPEITLKDVYYIPSFHVNLLSVSKLCQIPYFQTLVIQFFIIQTKHLHSLYYKFLFD